MVGDRANKLEPTHFPADVNSRIVDGIISEYDDPTEEKILAANDIGFHLVDWQSDAAFLVALTLFPERFTDEEVAEGVRMFLIHVPAHVIEAARLGNYPFENPYVDED